MEDAYSPEWLISPLVLRPVGNFGGRLAERVVEGLRYVARRCAA